MTDLDDDLDDDVWPAAGLMLGMFVAVAVIVTAPTWLGLVALLLILRIAN